MSSNFAGYSHFMKSPTRVDLAGGTLDLWPLYAVLGGATTINVGIDIYTYCGLNPSSGKSIKIHSEDFDKTWEFQNLNELLNSDDKELSFYKCHLEHWRPENGFELRTKSESPIGGGLGGSSSLSISLYKTMAEWLGYESSPEEMVRTCGNIEARLLHTPTGLQDYYPAIRGGINILQFSDRGIEWSVKEDVGIFLGSFCLIYTGRSHHSGMNNWQVLQDFVQKDPHTLEQLNSLKLVANDVLTAVNAGDLKTIGALFKQELKYRKALASAFSSPEIDQLASWSEKHDIPLKICGAGGGGCVLALYDHERDEQGLKSVLKGFGGKILEVNPVVL